MKVIYTLDAVNDLAEIWKWNAKQYGAAHANQYLQFLETETEATTPGSAGRAIAPSPNMHYRVLRRGRQKHSHLVVYEFTAGGALRVLRYFHTAQDWQSKL